MPVAHARAQCWDVVQHTLGDYTEERPPNLKCHQAAFTTMKAKVKPRVYLETTIVSYLVARPTRDVVIAGNQQTTRDWWQRATDRFELVASHLVFREAAVGDRVAAQARLDLLEGVSVLEAKSDASWLAGRLVETGAMPVKAAGDAAHIAIAVTNGVDYLLTWNCRHIANAAMRSRIERVVRRAAYEPTIICTPAELIDVDSEEG